MNSNEAKDLLNKAKRDFLEANKDVVNSILSAVDSLIKETALSCQSSCIFGDLAKSLGPDLDAVGLVTVLNHVSEVYTYRGFSVSGHTISFG